MSGATLRASEIILARDSPRDKTLQHGAGYRFSRWMARGQCHRDSCIVPGTCIAERIFLVWESLENCRGISWLYLEYRIFHFFFFLFEAFENSMMKN